MVIPLQEAASFGTMRSEVKRYTLGRRTTKEKVSWNPGLAYRQEMLSTETSCIVMMLQWATYMQQLVLNALDPFCAQVSGDIALGCRWRVSPLDVLALQLRGRQEELDHKQELVAIIKDW